MKHKDLFLGEIELKKLGETSRNAMGESVVDTIYIDESGNYYIDTFKEQHKADFIAGFEKALSLFAVSGSSAINRCNECSKELESGTVFCSADCRQHYYH